MEYDDYKRGCIWAKIFGGEMERQGGAMGCFGDPRGFVGKEAELTYAQKASKATLLMNFH